jgi:hypothetical protein
MMNAATRSARLGITGVVVGVLALVAAVLPHWVLPAVFPAKPLDQVIVDTAQRIKDRLKRGDTPTMPVQRSQSQIWSQALSIAAVSLGLLAIALAVFSTMRGEERRYAVMAAGARHRSHCVSGDVDCAGPHRRAGDYLPRLGLTARRADY